MLSVDETLSIILQSIKPDENKEAVSIIDSLDRILADDVYAMENIPQFDNSAMDGYALKAVDTKGGSFETPISLKIIDEVPAGYTSSKRVQEGQAIKIMTGAPIPEGADAVVMKEDTNDDSDTVKVFKEMESGENIRWIGEDVSIGQRVLKKGDVITPASIGLLAALGKSVLMVSRRPHVAVIATGDELVGIDETLTTGKIRSVNSYTISAQIKRCGAIPKYLGIAKDNQDEINEKIKQGLQNDIIIISAGVSVGDYDLVPQILKDLGLELKIYKVRIKPGKPFLFGILNDKPVFGLPGNVSACMVCFEKFVRPAILKMMGCSNIELPTITAVLKTDIKKQDSRQHLFRAKVWCEDGLYYAMPTKSQSSGVLMSMVDANGLIIVPEEVKRIQSGSQVKVELL